MSHFMWKRWALATAIVATAVVPSVIGQVGSGPALKAVPAADGSGVDAPVVAQAVRDQAAADEALKGWWTAALKNKDERLGWWREARFGCFIHWGVYTDPAGEYNGKKGGSYSEHIMRQLKIPLAEYKENIVRNFDPEKFDAQQWADLFQKAGMKYVVITAKHHDGFAMFPSDAYPYDIRLTKFKRDPMKELSEACAKRGIKFGFYYSHAFDWEHPDAPGNDWDYKNPGGDLLLQGGATWYNAHPELVPKAMHYVDQKAIPQLEELVKKYHPAIFWFDTSGKLPPSEQLRIVKAVRAADPMVVVNGRAARGMGRNWGDYDDTADNPAEVRDGGNGTGDWEAIPTTNNSYGYNKLDNAYKTPEFFVQLLAKTVAKGGNMLLNVGPMGTGEIDPHATEILQGIGKWMAVNGESIHDCGRTALDRQAWGDSTLKADGSVLYLHVFQWPSDGKLVVGGLKSGVKGAYLLADAAKKGLATQRVNEKDMVITVPAAAPDATDSVIVLQLEGKIEAAPGKLLATNIETNRMLAFDGKATGRFTYGDGKAARYYAQGFKTGESMSWNTRANEAAIFDVSVTYLGDGGSYQVKLGNAVLAVKLEASKTMKTVQVGRMSVVPGEVGLTFAPDGDALLSLFEINLIPVKK